jgi:hypothetical protein
VTQLKSFRNLCHVQGRKLADQVTDYRIQRVKFSSGGKGLGIALVHVCGNIRYKIPLTESHKCLCTHVDSQDCKITVGKFGNMYVHTKTRKRIDTK